MRLASVISWCAVKRHMRELRPFNCLSVCKLFLKPYFVHLFRHIMYCMKYVNMLLQNNIKPILVFDGRHLPAKAETEAKRRE